MTNYFSQKNLKKSKNRKRILKRYENLPDIYICQFEKKRDQAHSSKHYAFFMMIKFVKLNEFSSTKVVIDWMFQKPK